MFNYCRMCLGYGTVPTPHRKWWQFWKFSPCVKCGGDGMNHPLGWPDKAEMARLRPPPPPPPPPPHCCCCKPHPPK